jgi:hypothetical protein
VTAEDDNSNNFTAQTERVECSLGRRSSAWGLTDSTVMRKWKWMFVNSCECKRPISAATAFLKFNEGWKNASVCLEIVLQSGASVSRINELYLKL